MKTIIYKYPINIHRSHSTRLEFKHKVKFLSVGTDRTGTPCIWVMEYISEFNNPCCYEIIVIGTGEDMQFFDDMEFLGTVFIPPDNNLLWHIFVRKSVI